MQLDISHTCTRIPTAEQYGMSRLQQLPTDLQADASIAACSASTSVIRCSLELLITGVCTGSPTCHDSPSFCTLRNHDSDMVWEELFRSGTTINAGITLSQVENCRGRHASK